MPIGSGILGTLSGKPTAAERFERIKLPYLKMPSKTRFVATAAASHSFALLERSSSFESNRVKYQSARVIPTSKSI